MRNRYNSANKLHRISDVMPDNTGIKHSSYASAGYARNQRGISILMKTQQYWMQMETFRRDRERNKNYTYGRQWDDMVCVDGRMVKESEQIIAQGNVPLKNNLIRRMVRSVLGVYSSQQSEPTCSARDRDEQQYSETMSTLLQCNMQLNQLKELNQRSLEEFLISGFVVYRKWYGWRNNRLDCWTDYVQPNNFFIDSNMRDFRGWDVSCLGEVHDVSIDELCGRFGHSPREVERLKEIYREAAEKRNIGYVFDQFGYPLNNRYDFLVPADSSQCRVIEVWQKEMKPRYRCHDLNTGEVFKIEVEDYDGMVANINASRIQEASEFGIPREEVPLIQAEWFIDSFWYFYCLSPFGDILDQGESPYEHKEHPYVFKAYPFIDGEIHSFTADVIDQQRYVNRLIMMYDWIMRASAKGVLLFPEECLPDDMTLDDIADEWARFNGVIMIKKNNGQMLPKQVANNCTQIGISELLSMQLKFFEDISGVNGALQGKPGMSGMSASLYSQQTQNATTSLLDILDTFSAFIREGAYKDVKNIQQYYEESRVINIAGEKASLQNYNHGKFQDIEFDLSIAESTATPIYRALANDFLMQLFNAGAINVEMLLEHGTFPQADALLQSIRSMQQQIQQQQTGEQSPAEIPMMQQ